MAKFVCERCFKEYNRKSSHDKHVNENKCYDMTDELEKLSIGYSSISQKLNKNISLKDKKQDGIFFTPITTIKENIKFLQPYMKDIEYILEPSCGSCEYIMELNRYGKKFHITGVEYNKTIYESIKELATDNVSLYNTDFLRFEVEQKYDLIIGNPPYFVLKKTNVEPRYHDFFDGRPNIFILFILKSLKLLNPNGILSFVLPRNFLNCAYYDKTRKYLSEHYTLLNIMNCNDSFMDTNQATIIVIFQNKKDKTDSNDKYILNINDFTIFGEIETIIQLKELCKNSTTLDKLDFVVNVGTVVWNQCKNILTDDNTKTLLIYSSDIKSNTLQIQNYNNPDKKNYIKKKGVDKPLLVVNRGYGIGNYKFDYLLIKGGFEYLIENHLICIKYSKPISDEDLIVKYKKILSSLDEDKTKEFIKLYFGNSAINTTELCKVLPIF